MDDAATAERADRLDWKIEEPPDMIIDLPEQCVTIEVWRTPEGAFIRSTGLGLEGDAYHLGRAQLRAMANHAEGR